MDKIPTSEEFEENNCEKFNSYSQLMIEFARLHVEAALKEANENVEVICDSSGIFQSIDKNSILNAYPIDLIK